MFDYGIGGQERKLDIAQEAIADISLNRTLLIQKLTSDPPLRAQIVEGLRTPEAVFSHYKPVVEVEFEKEDGTVIPETLRFQSLGDFGKKGIINQSGFLQDLNTQADDLQKLLRQLKSNKILKSALDTPETKAAFLAAIQTMISELD